MESFDMAIDTPVVKTNLNVCSFISETDTSLTDVDPPRRIVVGHQRIGRFCGMTPSSRYLEMVSNRYDTVISCVRVSKRDFARKAGWLAVDEGAASWGQLFATGQPAAAWAALHLHVYKSARKRWKLELGSGSPPSCCDVESTSPN